MQEPRYPRPWVVCLMGALGGVGGAGGIWLAISSYGAQSAKFLETPRIWLWIYIIGVLCAFIVISAALSWVRLRQLREHFAGNKLEIAISTFVIALLFVAAAFIAPKPVRLPYLNVNTSVVVGLAGVVGVLPVVGILLVYAALRTSFRDLQPGYEPIEKYLALRRHLQLFLSILGGLTGLGTLATGALRNVIIAAKLGNESEFPLELVLAYGASFTFLVALVYIPTYVQLAAAGRRIRDAFCPMSSLELDSLAKWHSRRESLEELLHLRVGVGQSFQTGMAIFAPLVGSVIAILIET